MQVSIAKRPVRSTVVGKGGQVAKPLDPLLQGSKVSLLTNYYRFDFTNPDKKKVHKYHVKFEPELSDNSQKVRSKLVNGIRDQIQQRIGFFIYLGTGNIYTLGHDLDIPQLENTFEEITYKINVQWVQEIGEQDRDMLVFFKIFFNSLLKKIKFKQIGRNHFNPAASHPITEHNIEVWPGFASALGQLQSGVLLNIDIVHKVLRTDTVLNFINETKQRCRGDPREQIKSALIGSTVLTSYNKRTYKVDDINFDMSPMDTFTEDYEEGKDPRETSYQEYFQRKYGWQIKESNQPVIISVHQKTGNKLVLIPELCQMTGLSDSMRANFRLMKDMSAITHSDAKRRIEECRSLLETFDKNEKCVKEMKEWQIKISKTPHQVTGQLLKPGSMIMGKQANGNRMKFEIESAQDIDRKIQAQMYQQPALERWGIFYCENDTKIAKQFIDTMRKCFDTIRYDSQRPREFPIRGNYIKEWEKALRENLSPQVQCVVLLLPGAKGKAPLYDDLKRILLKDIPVPSQVVLSNTISRGKNIRSICSKILIQMCAKIGGEPWAVSDMPFFDDYTMVCGLDVYHNTGKKSQSVLAFCASINPRATKYWSSCKIQGNVGEEISNTLEQLMSDALKQFKIVNKKYPNKVIIYRDGVGQSQQSAVLTHELPQIQQAFKNMDEGHGDKIKMMIILVNKRVSQRFFNCENPQRLCNPLPGTIINSGIVEANTYDFYLVSQQSRQGVVSPTHYHIIYDTICEEEEKIQMLTFKLCYTYYNVSGSIKVPAPIQYAHRLANLVGDRGKGKPDNMIPIPHKYFSTNHNSLYFI